MDRGVNLQDELVVSEPSQCRSATAFVPSPSKTPTFPSFATAPGLYLLLVHHLSRNTAHILCPSLLDTLHTFLVEAELARVPTMALEVLTEARVLELDGVLADLGDEGQYQNSAEDAQTA